MINDVIADSLTRIRNAGMRRNEVTTLVYSKTVEAILSILKANDYIESFKVNEDGNKKSINVVLKYDEKGRFVISEIKRISKPGRRVYKNASELKSFKNGYGIIIVSTNKGVISNAQAYKENVGGEALCSIW
jgi:small subunit ribosomal protein S8